MKINPERKAMRNEFVLEFDGHAIVITTDEGAGTISSNLKAEDTPENSDYNAAVDGVESLLLAMACEGIDVGSPQMIQSVKTAIEGIANNC